MTSKKQYLYLNVLKTIAIIFVCIYHHSSLTNINDTNILFNFNRYFYNIVMTCVPIFFVVNGALLLNKDLDTRKHLKKTISLFIQFYIWRIITFFTLALYHDINFSNIGKIDYLNLLLFKNPDGDVLNDISFSHFWFIFSLIGIYLIVPFIKKGYNDFIKKPSQDNYFLIFIIILSALTFLPNTLTSLSKFSPTLSRINYYSVLEFIPFSVQSSTMLMYFILGGLLHRKLTSTPLNKKIFFFSILGGLLGLSLAYCTWLNESRFNPAFDGGFGGYATLQCFITTFSIATIIFYLTKYDIFKKGEKFFELIGRSTLFIYYSHWIIGKIFFISFIREYQSLVQIILIFILVILLALLAKVLEKIPVIKHLIK